MTLFILLIGFIVIAVALAWFFISHDRGEKEPISALWLAVGFGVAGCFAAALLENWLIPIHNLLPSAPHATLLMAAVTVGVIEEACKFIPLAITIYKRPFFNEHTDGVIYFALAGLGFGVPENMLYTLQFGTKAGLTRVLITPFFHAATTGILGYFLIRAKLDKKPIFGVAIAFVAVSIIHGLYDYGLIAGGTGRSVGALLTALFLSAALFIIFLKANQRDQDLGLSRVGHNSFCRACGFPNPHHKLYCVHCGKNA